MRKNNFVRLLVGALLIQGSATAFARGGDIGNGGLDNAFVSGCSHRGSDFYDCMDEVAIELRRTQSIAHSKAQGGRVDLARGELVSGLRRSINLLSGWSGGFYPLTLEALKRGVILNNQFKNCHQSCAEENRRAGRFISEYIEYVKRRIIPLDVDYRIPSYERGRHYSYDWWNAYIIEYRDAAVELLGLYLGGESGDLPHTLAIDDYETRVAEKMFYFVAEDLNRDDYRRFYRGTFMDIRDAAETLALWNNQRVGFAYSRHASQYARDAAKSIRDDIKQAPCEYRDEYMDDYYRGPYTSRKGRY